MIQLIWIIILPLIGFTIIGLIGNKLSSKGIALLGCGVVWAAFILSLAVFGEVYSARRLGEDGVFIQPLFNWLTAGELRLGFRLLVDPLSAIMLLVVTGVGGLIHIYSVAYMKRDDGFAKYFAYLNLFVFFMLVLVLGSNYVVMFIGWEGVGLCSYLLIGFWYKRIDYSLAAKKAFIMNRIGDLGFLIAMFAMFQTFGNLEFGDVLPRAASMQQNDQVLILISFMLFIAATGKSAQIPLFTWLPDAMAGPTPVSALIHAATMVTAGIYMIARSSVIFVLSPFTLQVIAVIGLLTALIAAIIAITQNDIKKVLAYSTVSQLGYMFLALGVGAFTAAFFHVITHAFFKALLFLGAGSVIHAMSNQQDMRGMGGLRKKLPITYITMLIGTIAISGIPPLAGFFSKDQILASAFYENKLLWFFGVIGAVLTAFYMFRMLFITFYGHFRGSATEQEHLHESPKLMTVPLIVLALLSILGGFINIPESLGGGMSLDEFLSPVFIASRQLKMTGHLEHSTEYVLMAISTIGVVAALFFAYRIYVKKQSVPKEDEASRSFLETISYRKFYVDEFYDKVIVNPLNRFSSTLYRYMERAGIDGLVNGLGKSFSESGKLIRLLQHGNVGFYVFFMVLGIIALLGYTVYYFN